VHEKLLSSHVHWKLLSIREKSFSIEVFLSGRIRDDRFTLGDSRRMKLRVSMLHIVQQKKITISRILRYLCETIFFLFRNSISHETYVFPTHKLLENTLTIHVYRTCNTISHRIWWKKFTAEYSAVFHS